jgi:hypothetical protein
VDPSDAVVVAAALGALLAVLSAIDSSDPVTAAWAFPPTFPSRASAVNPTVAPHPVTLDFKLLSMSIAPEIA